MRVGTLLASLRRVLEKHGERNLAVDYLFETIKRRQSKCFSAYVSELVIGCDRPKLHHLIVTALLKVTDPDRNVLLLLGELWHPAHRDACLVVDV